MARDKEAFSNGESHKARPGKDSGMPSPSSKISRQDLQRSQPQGEGGTGAFWRSLGIASWCPQREVKQGVRGSALGDPANLVFQTGCHLGAQHSHTQLQPATSTLTQQASLGVFQDTGSKGLQQSPRTHQNRRVGRAGQESCWPGVEPQPGREMRTRGRGDTSLAVRPSFSTKLLCNLGQVTARL